MADFDPGSNAIHICDWCEGSFQSVNAVRITDFPGTQETPEEFHFECPLCGREI